eukprot:351841-Chlamydomonas_euryale.AAC.18
MLLCLPLERLAVVPEGKHTPLHIQVFGEWSEQIRDPLQDQQATRPIHLRTPWALHAAVQNRVQKAPTTTELALAGTCRHRHTPVSKIDRLLDCTATIANRGRAGQGLISLGQSGKSDSQTVAKAPVCTHPVCSVDSHSLRLGFRERCTSEASHGCRQMFLQKNTACG